jgi:hypothetical protein
MAGGPIQRCTSNEVRQAGMLTLRCASKQYLGFGRDQNGKTIFLGGIPKVITMRTPSMPAKFGSIGI